MIKNDYDPSLYLIYYQPYAFLSFLFGGKLIVSCEGFQSINDELDRILPNLIWKHNGAAWGHNEWYECPVQNNKEAEDLLIELKILGYEIN